MTKLLHFWKEAMLCSIKNRILYNFISMHFGRICSSKKKVLWCSKVRWDWKYGELANLLHYASLTIILEQIWDHISHAESLPPQVCLSHIFPYLEPLRHFSQWRSQDFWLGGGGQTVKTILNIAQIYMYIYIL